MTESSESKNNDQKPPETTNDNPAPKKAAPKAPKEKFYKVRFHAKSNANDTDDVMLAVNGETLIIQREQEVILPERFLECADHTTFDQFKQMPGKPRKIVGKVKLFPYDRLGESTESEYRKRKADGTRMTRDHIQKHGFDLNPDD